MFIDYDTPGCEYIFLRHICHLGRYTILSGAETSAGTIATEPLHRNDISSNSGLFKGASTSIPNRLIVQGESVSQCSSSEAWRAGITNSNVLKDRGMRSSVGAPPSTCTSSANSSPKMQPSHQLKHYPTGTTSDFLSPNIDYRRYPDSDGMPTTTPLAFPTVCPADSDEGLMYMYVWGSNSSHQLAEGTQDRVVVPKMTKAFGKVKQAVAGHYCTFVVNEEGGVQACGKGNYGRLGLGDSSNQAKPRCLTFYGEEDIKISEISSSNGSDGHTLALTEDGRVYSWGDGEHGKLGHGNDDIQKLPRLITADPLAGRFVTCIAAGYKHSACVTREGELYTWGEGDSGRLGHGDNNRRYSPTLVLGIGQVGKVVCGITHTLALAADGKTVWSFGSGDHGKLGHGDSSKVFKPQVIDGLLGHTIKKLVTGTHVSLALSQTNEVWVWGSGPCLGLGSTEAMALEPRVIDELKKHRVVDIAAGDSHVLALTHDSQVYAWGANTQGQCGQGHTMTPLPLPRKVRGITTPVHHITAGTTHSIAWTRHLFPSHRSFYVDLEQSTFTILRGFLFSYCKFERVNIPRSPFVRFYDQHRLVQLVVTLLNNHLSLALAAGKTHALPACEAHPLRELLYSLIDTALPPSIEDGVCRALRCPLLLPSLPDRLLLLHGLLPRHPQYLVALSRGQKLQLSILLASLKEEQHIASILGYSQQVDGKASATINISAKGDNPSGCSINPSLVQKEEKGYVGYSLAEDLMYTLLINLAHYAEQQLQQVIQLDVKCRPCRTHRFNVTSTSPNIYGKVADDSSAMYTKNGKLHDESNSLHVRNKVDTERNNNSSQSEKSAAVKYRHSCNDVVKTSASSSTENAQRLTDCENICADAKSALCCGPCVVLDIETPTEEKEMKITAPQSDLSLVGGGNLVQECDTVSSNFQQANLEAKLRPNQIDKVLQLPADEELKNNSEGLYSETRVIKKTQVESLHVEAAAPVVVIDSRPGNRKYNEGNDCDLKSTDHKESDRHNGSGVKDNEHRDNERSIPSPSQGNITEEEESDPSVSEDGNKMDEVLQLLSSMQNHLLSYCTKHLLPPKCGSSELFHRHLREVFEVCGRLLQRTAALITQYPEKTYIIHEVAYCSILGKTLGVIVYSLCLTHPILIRPLLPYLITLLHTLDKTNRAVAVVAHITDQEDLCDEQDTPTPDTVKSVGGGVAGVVSRSWLWLLDIERAVGLVLGRCLQWMLAGGGVDCSAGRGKAQICSTTSSAAEHNRHYRHEPAQTSTPVCEDGRMLELMSEHGNTGSGNSNRRRGMWGPYHSSVSAPQAPPESGQHPPKEQMSSEGCLWMTEDEDGEYDTDGDLDPQLMGGGMRRTNIVTGNTSFDVIQ